MLYFHKSSSFLSSISSLLNYFYLLILLCIIFNINVISCYDIQNNNNSSGSYEPKYDHTKIKVNKAFIAFSVVGSCITVVIFFVALRQSNANKYIPIPQADSYEGDEEYDQDIDFYGDRESDDSYALEVEDDLNLKKHRQKPSSRYFSKQKAKQPIIHQTNDIIPQTQPEQLSILVDINEGSSSSSTNISPPSF